MEHRTRDDGAAPPGKRPRTQPPTSSRGGSAGKELPFPSAETAILKKKSKPQASIKKKDKNKTRSHRSDSVTDHHHRSSAHHSSNASSTATAEGLRMAQILSTFSQLEQSRFSAFQRSVLPTAAVEEWLAAVLSDRFHRTTTYHRISPTDISKASPLADLVAPGQDQDIVMVVATLAKIYAQRLVSTAVSLRREHQERDQTPVHDKTQERGSRPSPLNLPLRPQDVLRALEHRQKRGLDPGFFLSESSSLSARVCDRDHGDRHQAALAAQEEYDEYVSRQQAANEDPMAVEEPEPSSDTQMSR